MELATQRFRFYEDIDLFVPDGHFEKSGANSDAERMEVVKALEVQWIDQLLRIRG